MSDPLSELNPVTERRAIRVLRPDSPSEAVSLARRFKVPYMAGGTWLQPTHERDQCWPEKLRLEPLLCRVRISQSAVRICVCVFVMGTGLSSRVVSRCD